MDTPEEIKQHVLGMAEDAVSDMVYYHRKECEILDRKQITAAFKDGVVTTDEVVAEFKKHLEEWLVS